MHLEKCREFRNDGVRRGAHSKSPLCARRASASIPLVSGTEVAVSHVPQQPPRLFKISPVFWIDGSTPCTPASSLARVFDSPLPGVVLAAFLTSCGPGDGPGLAPRPVSASGAPARRLTAAPAPRFVWIEGEQPASANVKLNLAGWGNKQFLSGEKWLHVSVEADKVEKDASRRRGPDPLRLRREGRGRTTSSGRASASSSPARRSTGGSMRAPGRRSVPTS